MSQSQTKQDLLDQIKADILAKNICPDLAKTATNLVMGDGHPDADVVFIGEAPGKNEDEQGLPFVGAAGKFLNEMLAGIGLDRQDIYITNIVKYRPPNNRDPEHDEKKAFWPYLVRQLEVIQPKLVVTLGRHSMEYFLPEQKISVIHGQPKRIRVRYQPVGRQRAANDGHSGGSADEQPIMPLVILPLYHPAAALYNGGMREMLTEDFNQIPVVLKKLSTAN